MLLGYYQGFIDKIASREKDPINEARLKMLLYCLSSNLVFVTITSLIYLFQGPELQLMRASVSLFFAVTMLIAVCRWNVWRQVSHFVCMLITVMIWSNLLIYVQGINMPTIQFVFLIVVYSFYVHGLKGGTLYSVLNVFPIILYTAFDGKNYFALSLSPQAVSQSAYLFIVVYNFIVIIFIHFHFFRAFNKNIARIMLTKSDLRTSNAMLELTMKELESSSKIKMDFLSTISHELRTPLNGVIGLSNVILMDSPRADQKVNLDMLKFSAENLLSLINDILDFNKLDAKKIELERVPFYLPDLLMNTAGSLKINAAKKGLDFRISVAPDMNDKLIYSDPTRLTQVLTNLVNNAVKFTDNGFVSLETQLLEISERNMKVRFLVEDSGIGIENHKQEDIFEPFMQASKSTTREFGGTGLGLPIVKNILSVFNAEIKLTSEFGRGSKFWFDLDFPYELKVSSAPEFREVKKDGLKGLKVLVAEDNLINIMVIKKMLAQWGIMPVIAENGKLAVDTLTEQYFDIVLMDLHMPVMDGYQATKEIRQMRWPEKANINIVALTASVSHSIASKVMEAGMNGYISKPFNPEHLYERLAGLRKLTDPHFAA